MSEISWCPADECTKRREVRTQLGASRLPGLKANPPRARGKSRLSLRLDLLIVGRSVTQRTMPHVSFMGHMQEIQLRYQTE